MKQILIIFLVLSATYLHGQNHGTVGQPGGGFVNAEDSIKIAVLSYKAADGVNGMDFTATVWRPVQFTEVIPNELGISLADDSTFTLPAGKYQMFASTTTFLGIRRLRLVNLTDVDTVLGTSGSPYLSIVTDIEATKTYRIEAVLAVSNSFQNDGITGTEEDFISVTIINLQGNAGEVTKDGVGKTVPDGEIIVGKGTIDGESYSGFQYNSSIGQMAIDGSIMVGDTPTTNGGLFLHPTSIAIGQERTVSNSSQLEFHTTSTSSSATATITRNSGSNGNWMGVALMEGKKIGRMSTSLKL